MPNLLTKDGLTGNSGMGVANLSPTIFHIAANYAATKRKCFVVTHTRSKDGPSWRRMTVAQAKKQNLPIIPCSYCKRPAISLDHYWPYYSEANHCAWHRNWGELCKDKE